MTNETKQEETAATTDSSGSELSGLLCVGDGEDLAINVTQEAADVYYANAAKLPKNVKSKLSLHDYSEIFIHMVVPAIDKARKLDRG